MVQGTEHKPAAGARPLRRCGLSFFFCLFLSLSLSLSFFFFPLLEYFFYPFGPVVSLVFGLFVDSLVPEEEKKHLRPFFVELDQEVAEALQNLADPSVSRRNFLRVRGRRPESNQCNLARRRQAMLFCSVSISPCFSRLSLSLCLSRSLSLSLYLSLSWVIYAPLLSLTVLYQATRCGRRARRRRYG